MEPTSSAESLTLLAVARASIERGLHAGEPLLPDPSSYEGRLRELAATFVTLRSKRALRGCTGSLEPVRPLVVDVAHHAYGSAFDDPRFPPLAESELSGLELSIAILSRPVEIACASEAELLAQLRPGVDGLILQEGGRKGTFLPAVWKSLPEPRAFLRELKLKAGLSPDAWSPRTRVSRYTVEEIS